MPLVNILRGGADWHQRGGLYEHLRQEVEPDDHGDAAWGAALPQGRRGRLGAATGLYGIQRSGRQLACARSYVDTRRAEATSLFGYSFATLCSRMLR